MHTPSTDGNLMLLAVQCVHMCVCVYFKAAVYRESILEEVQQARSGHLGFIYRV